MYNISFMTSYRNLKLIPEEYVKYIHFYIFQHLLYFLFRLMEILLDWLVSVFLLQLYFQRTNGGE